MSWWIKHYCHMSEEILKEPARERPWKSDNKEANSWLVTYLFYGKRLNHWDYSPASQPNPCFYSYYYYFFSTALQQLLEKRLILSCSFLLFVFVPRPYPVVLMAYSEIIPGDAWGLYVTGINTLAKCKASSYLSTITQPPFFLSLYWDTE